MKNKRTEDEKKCQKENLKTLANEVKHTTLTTTDKAGQRIRISTKTSSRDRAIEIRDVYFENLKDQQKNNAGLCYIKQEYTFDDIALKFLEDKTRSCRSKTVKDYKFLLKSLFSFFYRQANQ